MHGDAVDGAGKSGLELFIIKMGERNETLSALRCSNPMSSVG
jgi:hypothetical protein